MQTTKALGNAQAGPASSLRRQVSSPRCPTAQRSNAAFRCPPQAVIPRIITNRALIPGSRPESAGQSARAPRDKRCAHSGAHITTSQPPHGAKQPPSALRRKVAGHACLTRSVTVTVGASAALRLQGAACCQRPQGPQMYNASHAAPSLRSAWSACKGLVSLSGVILSISNGMRRQRPAA